MEMTGNVLVLFCVGLAVVPGVQSACTDINAYNHLNDFMLHDKCESADMVFKYLHDMTVQTNSGNCRRQIINKLADHYGTHAHTADHCQCSGSFKLQNYSRPSTHDTCMQHTGYRDLYYQFFTSNHQPHDLVCRTHHLLWTHLRDIQTASWECQKDIVYHIYDAFSLHDPCTCSEKHVTTTHSPSQHAQGYDHCDQFNSYQELASLANHSKCLSANTVWHLLDDLQKGDSGCRTHIQNLLSHSYSNVPTDGNNKCMCTPKDTLTDTQLHHTSNDHSYTGCRDHEPGSTYRAIEMDLFTHITNHGCRNHNYLWPTLAGVKDHNSTRGYGYHYCTLDLITRAAKDYPSQDSDNCTCVQETTTSSTTRTTTTTKLTTHQITTPATTTKHSDVTTAPNETTTHSPSQNAQGHDHCDQINSYKELATLVNHSQCLSANTVWHLLDDLQKHDSGCRTHIQNLLLHSYNNVTTDGHNECVCTPKHTLTNEHHLHYTHTNYDANHYNGCIHAAGSTYSAIERDLFTNITVHGCRNHNYLWPTLTGVKNYYNKYINANQDCTLDLITRATMDYPSQASDNCTCVQKTITSSMAATTTTIATTQQTTTPTTTTTTKSDVTTTLHGSTVVTHTTVSSHNEDGWESWSPWTCKITKSDLSATCHNFRQRHCLSNIGCEGSSSETMDCNDSQCSDADITYVNCSVYNRSSACEDQASCTYFSNKPWQICGNAAYVAQCPRLCTCCTTTTTSPTTTTTQTTTPPPPPTTTITTTTTTSPTTTLTMTTATSQPSTPSTTTTSQETTITTQPSATAPSSQCNHTCTLDAVILSTAVKNAKAVNCSDKTSASNEALPMDCCSMGDHNNWTKGEQVQTNRMCTDGTPPPYTPIAAFTETGFLIPDTAGIFYGCIKDRQSGFMMIHQTCELLPHLLHVDGTKGKDPNIYFMFH